MYPFVLFIKYYINNHIKEDKVYGACSTHEEVKNINKMPVGNPEGKRPTQKTKE